MRVGDTTRSFLLYAPPAARRGGAPIPLLLAFHGSGSSGTAFRTETGLDAAADRAGFLVAYPDAAVGNWAENCGCNLADRLGVNDTGFVRALVASVAARYPVDRSRVYAVGFSQGGLFVHRLGCEMADVVTAVASISAPMSAPLARRCTPTTPVAALVMMGTLDASFPYEGGGASQRTTLGARETVRVWRVLSGCGEVPEARSLPDRTPDGTTVLEERWTACASGREVALYTVDGGRHAWAPSADVATADLVTSFLLRQRR